MSTKTCFDYSTTNLNDPGNICTGSACKIKRVRYYRVIGAKRQIPTSSRTTNTTVKPKAQNMLVPKVQPVLINPALFNFNRDSYFKLFNAQIAKYFSDRFPFSTTRKKRYAPYPTGSGGVAVKNANGNWEVVNQFRTLPPGQFETRLSPDEITGKEAFQKWYSAYASNISEPGARWKIIFDHLSTNWSNYAETTDYNNRFMTVNILAFIKAINDAYAGIIKIPTQFGK